MDAKLAVSGSMDLVKDMETDAKRATRPNNLVFPYLFLTLSQTLFILLSTEIQRFEYSEISLEDCEVRSLSSPIGKSRVDAYGLD